MLDRTYSHMTDADLEKERLFWDDEIASADRWGVDLSAANSSRAAVEDEQRRRRLARVRGEPIQIRPIVFDDPGVRPRGPAGPMITGAAKSRSQRRISAPILMIAIGALICCLAASMALAGQRIIELDTRYAAQERV